MALLLAPVLVVFLATTVLGIAQFPSSEERKQMDEQDRRNREPIPGAIAKPESSPAPIPVPVEPPPANPTPALPPPTPEPVEEPPLPPPVAPRLAPPDEITLTNGRVVAGWCVAVTDGHVMFRWVDDDKEHKKTFGAAEVASLRRKGIPVELRPAAGQGSDEIQLADGRAYRGRIVEVARGAITFRVDGEAGDRAFQRRQVKALVRAGDPVPLE